MSGVYIPQDLDYLGPALNIDPRARQSYSAFGEGCGGQRDYRPHPPTAMIAPTYRIDPKTGNNYMVTVQYANHVINHMTMEDFGKHSSAGCTPHRLRSG